MKAPTEDQGAQLADLGVLIRVEGSHPLIPLTSLGPAALRVLWPHINEILSPAEVVDRLLKGDSVTEEHQRIEQEEAAWAQVARGELVATKRAADAERDRRRAESAAHAKALEPTPQERAAAKIRMENRWLSFISAGRRKKQKQDQAARHELEMTCLTLQSDATFKAKEVAERAVEAYRAEIGRQIEQLNQAYDRGENWRALRARFAKGG